MAEKFILVDGSSYLYRAFHALPPLTTSKGEPSGAVYGVINMIKRLIKDYAPHHMAVVFDAKGKTFRDDLYPHYKANRPTMPVELQQQIAPLHAIVKAMGIPLLMVEGVEADDVIGTLAVQATEQGIDTLVSTGDKDMAQLVSAHVTLINTMSGQVLDQEGVMQKFGVPVERIIDYFALIGDKVDNVPGVPKVGPKTAVKWLNEYGDLDTIINRADEVKGKIGENLRESLEQLPLSRTLVTIKSDVALDFAPKDLKLHTPDEAQLIELFTHLEFKSWLSELLDQAQSTAKTEYQTVLNEKDLKTWLKKLEQSEVFAFDTETSDLNYMKANCVGVSFAVTPEQAAYVPFGHDYEGAPQQLTEAQVFSALEPLLQSEKHKKIGHHIKYDRNILKRHGIALNGITFDTMLESYVLNSSSSRHNLDALALKYLGHKNISFEDVAGKGVKQLTFNQVPLDTATPYAAEDADITLRLHQKLWPELSRDAQIKKIFDEIEMPLLTILSDIELKGVLVDAKQLHQQSEELAKQIAKLEQEAFEVAGETFNLGSPKQLQEILYNKLKLPILQKTPKGQPSTAEAVLQELSLDYPLPQLILEYRSLSKLKSTYTDTLPEQIIEETGRVHTSYHQAVTSTGRLSSSDPNLQNIPVRTEEGRRIRKAFIAPKGYKLLAADYSQIELRLMAHMSGDQNLLKAFENGWDVHSSTASEVFGVPLEKVSREQRRRAKAINFGLIYGMSAFGLAKQLKVDRYDAQEYIDIYFERYPNVKTYMDKTRRLAHHQGYVETHFGRKLYLAEINSSNQQRVRAAERAAINAPLQGTAADIIKLAMIAIDKTLKQKNLDATMIMQVHDELVLEVAEDQIDAVSSLVNDCMCNVAKLAVPIEVSIGVGDNWEAAH